MGQENPLCCDAPGARNGFGPGLVAICSSLPRPFHPLWLWGTASCVCMSPPAVLWAAALLCGRGPGSAGAAESRLGAAPGTGITGIAPCPATAPGGPPCPGALPQFPHRILQQRLPLPKGHWGSGGVTRSARASPFIQPSVRISSLPPPEGRGPPTTPHRVAREPSSSSSPSPRRREEEKGRSHGDRAGTHPASPAVPGRGAIPWGRTGRGHRRPPILLPPPNARIDFRGGVMQTIRSLGHLWMLIPIF